MKTTLELPDDLLRRVKLRAVQQNRKLKDMVAELLEKAMNQPQAASLIDKHPPTSDIEISSETGLPIVRSPPDAAMTRMSTEEVYALIRQAQDEEDAEKMSRVLSSG